MADSAASGEGDAARGGCPGVGEVLLQLDSNRTHHDGAEGWTGGPGRFRRRAGAARRGGGVGGLEEGDPVVGGRICWLATADLGGGGGVAGSGAGEGGGGRG